MLVASQSPTMNKSPLIWHEVALVAGVPETNRAGFIRLIGIAIRGANKGSSRIAGKNISAGALIEDFFIPIVGAADELLIGLERLQGEPSHPARLPDRWAPLTFSARHCNLDRSFEPLKIQITHLLRSLDLGLVIDIAERAGQGAKKSGFSKSGRKKGTGRPAFDMFVMSLLAASEQTGGKLTIYKTPYEDDRWAESLLKVVQQTSSSVAQIKFLSRWDARILTPHRLSTLAIRNWEISSKERMISRVIPHAHGLP